MSRAAERYLDLFSAFETRYTVNRKQLSVLSPPALAKPRGGSQ